MDYKEAFGKDSSDGRGEIGPELREQLDRQEVAKGELNQACVDRDLAGRAHAEDPSDYTMRLRLRAEHKVQVAQEAYDSATAEVEDAWAHEFGYGGRGWGE